MESTLPSDETLYDMASTGSAAGEMESTLPSDETLYDMASTGSAGTDDYSYQPADMDYHNDHMYLMEDKYNSMYHVEDNNNPMYHTEHNYNANPEKHHSDHTMYAMEDHSYANENDYDYNNYATEQASYDLYYPSEEPQFAGYDYNNYATEQASYDVYYPSEEPQFAGYDDRTYETEHSYEPHYPSNEPEDDYHHRNIDGYGQEHAYYEDTSFPEGPADYDEHTSYPEETYHEHSDHHGPREDYPREAELYEQMPPCLKDCALTDVDFEEVSSICEWWNVEGPVHNNQSCFNDCSPGIKHVVSADMEQMCTEGSTDEEHVDPLECVMDCPIDGLNPHSAKSFCPWFEKEQRNGCFLDCSDEFLNMAQEHADHTCSEWEQSDKFTSFEINEPLADAVAEENRDRQPLCPAGFVKRENKCEVCLAGTFSLEGTFDCIPCPDMLTSFPGSKSEEECFARGTLEPSN